MVALVWLWDALGLQLQAWALGMTVTVVLLDSAPGLARDHPPRSWRIAGASAGALALAGLLCYSLGDAPGWLLLAVVLPHLLMTLAWSWQWVAGTGAGRRRLRGREALILGLLSLLFVSLESGVCEAQSGLLLAAFAGSAALLGGLTTTLLITLLAHRQGEVDLPATPYGVPAQVVAVGLGICLLALLDALIGPGCGGSLLLWALLSLLILFGLTAAGHRLFPRQQPSIWAAALGSVFIGQMILQSSLFLA